MTKEPFENPQLHELATWESLITSENWKVYLKLCKDHKECLVKECYKSVLKADFHNAVCYAAKAEDVEKQLNLITARMGELRREGAKDAGQNER